MSQVKVTKKSKKEGKAPSLFSTLLIVVPLVVVFFVGGLFLGLKLSDHSEDGKSSVSNSGIGLPNTNNIFTKWKYSSAHRDPDRGLRGPILDPISSHGVIGEGLAPRAAPSAPVAQSVDGAPAKSISSASALISDKAYSLHARRSAYMTGPKNLDDANVLVTAWIYLDEDAAIDNDMRTIFSNKGPGCESGEARNGLALYVNGWQQSDHKLYLEYGGQLSGCHKLDSGATTLSPSRWYHVAVFSGSESSALYIDGAEVAYQQFDDNHSVQSSNPLLVGQYHQKEYPFYGNISTLTVSHGVAGSDRSALTALVNQIKDSPLGALSSLDKVRAVFPLTEAVSEADLTAGKDIVGGSQSGVFSFPPKKIGAIQIPGIRIDLIDGIGPRKVTPEMTASSDALGRERREKIKDGMKFAWGSYKKYAWGRDELKPQSNAGSDPWGGMGVTLVDSLDTLWVMGMKQEFEEARQWVERDLTFGKAGAVSVFETTIRELGGLLSAYDLSGEKVFLDRAKQLGDLLMPAFGTQTGIALGQVNFRTGSGGGGWSGGAAILSELGTLQLEFRYLGQALKEVKYEERSMKGLRLMNKKRPPDGLFPIKISIHDGSFADSHVTFGALGDSFYEYLLKVWLQGGKKETWLREMYDAAMDGVMNKLLMAADPSGLAFLSDWTGSRNVRKMDHLVCFVPGMLALGAYNDPLGLDSKRAQRDLAVARALMYTCYQMYARQPTGIAPEYVEFPPGRDMIVGSTAPFYILRPETAESLFILNQLTGEPQYREWAWQIWEAIDSHCRTGSAYGALADVTNGRKIDDRMESFFLAETMKYLYLAQDPDRPIDLTQYVFNTEAHPMKMFDSSHKPVDP